MMFTWGWLMPYVSVKSDKIIHRGRTEIKFRNTLSIVFDIGFPP